MTIRKQKAIDALMHFSVHFTLNPVVGEKLIERVKKMLNRNSFIKLEDVEFFEKEVLLIKDREDEIILEAMKSCLKG